jgi:hypothetical protein
MVSFFNQLDVPGPMANEAYSNINDYILRGATTTQEDAFQEAAIAIRRIYSSVNTKPDDVLDICVSFDWTWHKRGHSSHYGVGIAIEVESGLIIDAQVLSNFCVGCKRAPPPESDPKFLDWKANHKCEKNHDGSANAMEVAAARILCKRSVEKYRLRYRTILCDGDAKTLSTLNNEQVYGPEIELIKKDCVNHVAKRMYKGIEVGLFGLK